MLRPVPTARALRDAAPHDDPATHEAAFLVRYAALLRAARRLVRHATAAEDLVHDAFVRFCLVRPDLERIVELDRYLAAMLRNIHLSRVRRANGPAPAAPRSTLDFDSAELALRGLDPRHWLEARDTLRAAVRYGCARRHTSKIGSVFLLRFIHGLVPSEIGLLIGSRPSVVDEWLRLARTEVKRSLRDASEPPDRPEAAAPPRHHRSRGSEELDAHAAPIAPAAARDRQASPAALALPAPPRPAMRPAGSPDAFELVADLRQQVFAARHPTCPVRPAPGNRREGALDTALVAEIVCCPVCLAAWSAARGLPDLTDRFPPDTLGTNRRSGGVGGSRPTPPRAASPDGRVARARREMLEYRQHHPSALALVINGFTLATQRVAGDVCEQHLQLALAEPVAFVEVFSEQGVCLLAMPVDPPPLGAVEEMATTRLSGGRELTAHLSFDGPWPSLHLRYHAAIADPEATTEASGATIVPLAADRSRDDEGHWSLDRHERAAHDAAVALAGAVPAPDGAPRDAGDRSPDRDEPDAHRASGALDAPCGAGPRRLRAWDAIVSSLNDVRAGLQMPRRWSVRLAWALVIGWLLFATPFVEASIATQVGRLLSAAIVRLLGGPATTPVSIPPPRATNTPPPRAPQPAVPVLDRHVRSGAAFRAPRVAPAPNLAWLDATEIALWHRLHRLHLCDHTAAQIARTTAGGLRVTMTVADAMQQAIAARAFEPSTLPDGVDVAIQVAPRAFVPSPSSASFPARPLLRAFFAGAGTTPPDEAAIERAADEFAAWAIAQTTEAAGEIAALDRVTARWTPHVVLTLDPDAGTTWQSMVRDHVLAFQQQTQALRAQLQPMLGEDGPPLVAGPELAPVTDISQIAGALADLRVLSQEEERLARALFLPHAAALAANRADLVILWQTLTRADARAASLLTKPWALGR